MSNTPQSTVDDDARGPFRPALIALLAVTLLLTPAAADWTYEPLSSEQVAEVRAAIAAMKTDPRGPWLRIRWFCEDGTVQPPEPFACREHGGGTQHAELKPEIARLGELGFHFGTIYTAMDSGEFLDRANSGYRLRELVLQEYLESIDDGWILRRARFYRGARQAENEEVRGRELLHELLADRGWRRTHPLLATLLAGVVPHGAPGTPGAGARDLATRIADRDPRFQELRVKIHSSPGPGDLPAVEGYLRENRGRLEDGVVQLLVRLVAELDQAYRMNIDEERWRAMTSALEATPMHEATGRMTARLSRATTRDRIEILATFLRQSREALASDLGIRTGRRALALLDGIRYAEALLFTEASSWVQQEPELPRAAALGVAEDLLEAAYGTGWLTERELATLRDSIDRLLSADRPSGAAYAETVRYVTSASDWGMAALQQDFGPILERYAAVEPLAKGFTDDAVRSSVLLPFATLMKNLATDAAEQLDMTHLIFGRRIQSAALALNPGVALGPLYVVEDLAEMSSVDPDGIYVLPETPTDLERVAGILTLEQGSRLSHVQLLARGLGIPNAMVGSELLPTLRSREGETVLYAVSSTGSIVLDDAPPPNSPPTPGTPPPVDGSAGEQPIAPGSFAVDTARLDLSVREILPLAELDVEDSGRIVGPKAANLGRLHALFPGRVSPGLVLPFGIFRAHIDRDLDGDGRTLHEEIVDVFRTEREATAAGQDAGAVRGRVLARLESIRTRIRGMELLPEFRRRLDEQMRQAFGTPGSYGVFVRSDTNVEDLPNFSGAGLNLTVMNVIGTEAIFQAIRDVWASPFSQRSYLWRQRLIRNAEAVYPSIVLLQSVASEASGVLVTDDITGSRIRPAERDYWTVTVSQGVGGVVDGGAAETVLLPAESRPGAEPVLLSSARAVWQKRLAADGNGGMEEVPVQGADTLLTEARAADLREVVQEILRRYPPRAGQDADQPWDIEFGFLGDRTILFQIRPFVTGGETGSELLEELDRRVLAASDRPIDLQGTVTVEDD